MPSSDQASWALSPGQFGPSHVQVGRASSWTASWRRRRPGPSGLPQRLVGDGLAWRGDRLRKCCIATRRSHGMSAQTAGHPWAVLLLFSRLDFRPLTTASLSSPLRFVLYRGLVVSFGSGAAEDGTGRRPHARPEAASPSAEPAALRQYRN
jgi:hypothetical protein